MFRSTEEYSDELRERATRMALAARAAIRRRRRARSSEWLTSWVHPESLAFQLHDPRRVVGGRAQPQTAIDLGLPHPGPQRRELHRANEIRTSAAFFATAELDRKLK